MKAKILFTAILLAATNLALAEGGGIGFVDESEISQSSPLANFYKGHTRLAKQKSTRQIGTTTPARNKAVVDNNKSSYDNNDQS